MVFCDNNSQQMLKSARLVILLINIFQKSTAFTIDLRYGIHCFLFVFT